MIFTNFCKYIKNIFKKQKNMAKKLKKYRISPDESMCLALSIVDSPAVESEFVCLGKQEMEKFVAAEDKGRHMIYGCALRSDFPIYRNNGSEEYYIEFDSEAIDKISKEFFKNGFQKKWTEGHAAEVDGLTITESWIKESMNFDKSIAVGLDPSLPCGSWFIGCYCENEDIWNAVKEGKYHGFSCEALVGLEEFEKQVEKTEEVVEANLEEQTTTTDAKTEETVETAVEPSKVEEPTPTKEEVKEEPVAKTVEEKEDSTEPKTEPKQEDNHLAELINSLKEEINALKEMNTGLQSKIKDLAKQPSTKPVNTNAKPSAGDTYANWRRQMADYLA